MLKTASRIVALFVIAVVMSLSWTQSGRTAALCTVERGIDPLDIFKQDIRHNVWIGIDNSGSMSGKVDGDPLNRDRLDVLKASLTQVINDVGDSVNWGFFYTAEQNDSNPQSGHPACAVPQTFNADGGLITTNASYVSNGLGRQSGNCVGLERDDMILPVACGDNDTRQTILDMLRPDPGSNVYDAAIHGSGGIRHNGGTANAPSLDQIATFVARDYMGPDRPAGQKNVIIYLSDGAEDCACEVDPDGSSGVPDFINYPLTHPGYDPLSPNFDSAVLRVDDTPGSPVFETRSAFGGPSSGITDAFRRAYNAGMMARNALSLIDPNFDGSEGDIYIGYIFDDSVQAQKAARHWGWEASGYNWSGREECPVEGGFGCARPGFMANDEGDLADQLKAALGQIGVPDATVSAGASVVGSVKEVIASHTNTTHGLTGADLLASGIADTEVRRMRASHRNNVLFTTSVETPGFQGHLRAFNIYNVQADESRTADFTEIWDAGEVLKNRELGSDPRTIYFHDSNGNGGQLGDGSLTATDLGVAAGFLSDLDPTGQGAKNSNDAVEIVEKVLQGWRLVVDPVNGFYDGPNLNFSEFEADGITRTWKLLEATNSSPAVVLNPPRSPDVDAPQPTAEYGTFYEEQINRMTAVYLGTNGGMMQAFRADNGYELYGYIPHDLLPKLPNLVRNLVSGNNGVLNHEFFVASSATVQDAFLQDSPNGVPEWRTVLAFGRGAGGKFLTGLDITDVGEWDGTESLSSPTSGSQPPELLFTVGNRDGVADLDPNGENYDGFGETWSLPMMERVHNGSAEGQWVLFIGGGYGCTGTNEGQFLYVLKLEDGTVYKKLGPVADVVDASAGEPGIDQNGLVATPALFNPHESGTNDGRDFVTRVYIGDLQGVIHKLDCTDDDPANWQFGVFFEVTSEADQAPGQGNHDQPITVQAAVMKLAGSDQIYLFVGTGGDSRVELTDPDRFKIVGMEDTDSAGTILTTDPAFPGNLLTLEDGTSKFFLDLPEGDQMTVPPVLARNTATNGVVFFATNRREFDATSCSTTYFGTLFAAGVTTGLGSFDLDPNTGGVQDQVDLGQGKVTGLFHRDEHLYVSKSGDIGTASGTDVRGSDSFPAPPVAAGTVQILVDGFRYSPF